MAIGLLDFNYPQTSFCRLADSPATQAHWPLGKPEGVETFGDLGADDHLVLEVRSRSLTAKHDGLRCRVSSLLAEPPEIHPRYYHWLRLLGHRYHRVLTHNNGLIRRLPNARFFPHGGCYLSCVPAETPEKSERVALIASNKRYAAGHKLRHRIATWSREAAPDLQLFGRGVRTLDKKEEGHLPFEFSVVIENSREPGYFTEKVTDSFLCRSVPIYWGAPDITHFFDPRGMVLCHTEEEVRTAIRAVGSEDYAKRLPFLEENRRRALEYTDLWRNAALVLAHEDEVTRPIESTLRQAA